jgi:O-antigen/teichoic acid export membrane protein
MVTEGSDNPKFIDSDKTDTEQHVPVSKKLVLINSASSIAAYLLNTGVLLWLQPFLLGRVSLDEYALYPVVVAPLVFVPLLSIVLTGGLGRFGVEAYARGDRERVTRIVSTMFPLLAGASMVIMLLGALFAWKVEYVLDIAPQLVADARLMLILLVAAAALRVLLSPFEIGLFIRQKFILLNSIQVTTQIFRFTLLMVLLFGISPRVLWLVVAATIADSLGLIITVILSCRYVPALRFRRRCIGWECAPELLSFGGWTFVMQAVGTLRRGVIPILLNKLSTALQVSCFYLGSLAMQQIQYMTYLAMQPLLPALVAMHTRGDRNGLADVYLRGGRIGLWFVTFITLPLMIFSRELFNIYVGSEYLDAALVMALLLAMLPFQYGNVMLSHLAMATGKVRQFSLQVLFNQGISLALSAILIWRADMGAVGAAIGTSVVLTVMQPLVMWRMGCRMAGVTFKQWVKITVIPGVIPSLFALPGWLAVEQFLPQRNWRELILGGVPGAALFLVGLFIFGLTQQDRGDLQKILRRFGWSQGSS